MAQPAPSATETSPVKLDRRCGRGQARDGSTARDAGLGCGRPRDRGSRPSGSDTLVQRGNNPATHTEYRSPAPICPRLRQGTGVFLGAYGRDADHINKGFRFQLSESRAVLYLVEPRVVPAGYLVVGYSAWIGMGMLLSSSLSLLDELAPDELLLEFWELGVSLFGLALSWVGGQKEVNIRARNTLELDFDVELALAIAVS
ncbi:hypothetical protein B0T25DRAFT_285033 [Lasiosphaeria hispida]|uniref:Uncharacterized protein n=1 Tax=Lasiosphaeria hispida TaxID=260671 RepID=A0AAJ0HBT4_9PEZI|nr:hypothetical protein B0T25DRAFT_285033 [Lasiosphaeria hispida]